MKRKLVAMICALVLLVLPARTFSAEITLPIISVTDGDTIRTSLPLPCPLCNMYVRLLGVDTPERGKKARCPEEAAAGIKAKAAVTKLVSTNKTMTVKEVKWDKYGGRMNGVVFVGDINVGEYLLNEQLAAPYTGVGPKPNWCKILTTPK